MISQVSVETISSYRHDNIAVVDLFYAKKQYYDTVDDFRASTSVRLMNVRAGHLVERITDCKLLTVTLVEFLMFTCTFFNIYLLN